MIFPFEPQKPFFQRSSQYNKLYIKELKVSFKIHIRTFDYFLIGKVSLCHLFIFTHKLNYEKCTDHSSIRGKKSKGNNLLLRNE